MAYATVDQLRAYLDQIPGDASVPETDAKLAEILSRASAIIDEAIAAYLNVSSFGFAEYGAPSTKLVTGYGGEYLDLPPHQVGSVTLIEYQNSSNPVTWATLSVDYWDEEADGRIYYPNQFYGYGLSLWGPLRYRVTAIWGYGPVPTAIEAIVLELAVNMWRSKSKGGFTDNIGAEGGSYERFVGGLTKMQQEVITNVARRFWRPAV